jgi:hypothetical protein
MMNAVSSSEPVLFIGHRIGGMLTQTCCRLFSTLLVMVDAGHLGLWERHDQVCNAIAEFAQKYGTSEVPTAKEANLKAPQS